MLTFVIPGALRSLTDGHDRVRVAARVASVGDALDALWAMYPELRYRIVTERGEMRPHVNVFVGSDSIRDTGGLATPVADGMEIAIIPAVSGGRIDR
jgi:molybdopterin converting factor small subunit